jgi:oligopeptide/dipeptide ABC transporter ATP-binding protein
VAVSPRPGGTWAEPTRSAESRTVLEVDDLSAAFFTRRGVVRAVNQVSFTLAAGETLGLVGESGCGKSATAQAIMRILPFPGRVTGGRVRFEGQDLLALPERRMERIRGRMISLVPQDPTASLNPLLTVGQHLTEVLGVHLALRGRAAYQRAVELLRLVGIPEPERRFGAYPHQLSGGMRQRVMIAMAVACRPSLLIADEPTTALDATVQAQILDLLRALAREMHTATILITHNLGVVAGLCDRVAVMYAGRIVELAPRDELFANPRHPYTAALLRCVPRLDRVGTGVLQSIPGQPPDLIWPPPGCPFAPRCPLATAVCDERPPLEPVRPRHLSACWHHDQLRVES